MQAGLALGVGDGDTRGIAVASGVVGEALLWLAVGEGATVCALVEALGVGVGVGGT